MWWPLQRYLKLLIIWGSGTVKSLKQPGIIKAKHLWLATTTVYLPHFIPLFLPTVQSQLHWPRTHQVVSHLRAWLFSVPYAWNPLCSLFMWWAHSHPSRVRFLRHRAAFSDCTGAGHLWHPVICHYITFLISFMAFITLHMPLFLCLLTYWSSGFSFRKWTPKGQGPLYL